MTDTATVASRAEVGGRPRVVVYNPIPGDWSWAPETAILGGRDVDLIVPGNAGAADEVIRTADAVIVTDVSRLDASRVPSLERCVGILCSNDPDLPLVDRDELFRTADAVVLSATYTPGSPPLVAPETLALVKPGLILVNVALGGHVDEQALAEALGDGHVAVAALDVRAVEPPAPAGDPLAGLRNVILTPHVAVISRDAIDDLHRLAAEYFLDLLETGGRIPVAG